MLSMILSKLTAVILFVCSIIRDNIKILHGCIEESDELRDRVVEELSRQKLVFSKKENAWLRRRQID